MTDQSLHSLTTFPSKFLLTFYTVESISTNSFSLLIADLRKCSTSVLRCENLTFIFSHLSRMANLEEITLAEATESLRSFWRHGVCFRNSTKSKLDDIVEIEQLSENETC